MSMSTTVRVRCDGHMHTISLAEGGTIVLRNHRNIQAEQAIRALGSEPCRCLKALEAWRNRDRQALPAELRPMLDAAIARHAGRSAAQREHIDPLTLSLRERVARKTIPVAKAALESCFYRRSTTSWAGGNHFAIIYIGRPAISGCGDRVWSSNGKWPGTDSVVSATVPLTWLARVHRRGLAVVDGCFVLDVLDEDEKGITVLAGKQGRGFQVHPCRARVYQDAGGNFRLRWLKAENEGRCA